MIQRGFLLAFITNNALEKIENLLSGVPKNHLHPLFSISPFSD